MINKLMKRGGGGVAIRRCPPDIIEVFTKYGQSYNFIAFCVTMHFNKIVIKKVKKVQAANCQDFPVKKRNYFAI